VDFFSKRSDRIQKVFSAAKFGSKENARRAAVEYAEEQWKIFRPDSIKSPSIASNSGPPHQQTISQVESLQPAGVTLQRQHHGEAPRVGASVEARQGPKQKQSEKGHEDSPCAESSSMPSTVSNSTRTPQLKTALNKPPHPPSSKSRSSQHERLKSGSTATANQPPQQLQDAACEPGLQPSDAGPQLQDFSESYPGTACLI